MRPTPLRYALTGAAIAAATLLATVGLASAQAGQTGSSVSGCDNPVLNQSLAGWGVVSGATPFRYPLADHTSATAAYVQANNPAANPRAYLPQQPVKAGQVKTFAVDTRTDQAGQARVEVDWYSTTNAFLGHTNGPWTALAGGQPTVWKRVAADLTAPPAAARANVLAGSSLPAGADLSLTACSYTNTAADPVDPPETTTPPPPTSTEPPETTEPPVTSEPPPAGDQTEAAVARGWGTPLAAASDEFNYTGAPASAKWNQAGQCWPGHAGNGQRCANRSTVDGSKLVQTGLANGDSAWLASKYGTQYGRWEARVRSSDTGSNAYRYHPLLIIWPDSDRWPQDGEYDFLENGAPGQACAESFIHYPHNPGATQQEFKRETNCGAPLTEWHNVAVEWTPQHVKGFIDGVEWFSYSGGANGTRQNIQAMPSGHLTIQLDAFHGTGPYRPASYEVDWVRVYAP